MEILTLWHSNYDIETFNKIFDIFDINVIVDVRSIPYSKYSEQFNKENIEKFFDNKKIKYIHMWKELWAKKENEILLTNWKVDFNKVIELDNDFKEWIDRLLLWIEKWFKIWLMCSEKNPLECHRFWLIAKYLKTKIWISHIIKDNNTFKKVSNEEIEKELVKKFKIEQWLFLSVEDVLELSYQKLNDKIWWEKK